jgi:hypothetical protein
VQGFGSGWSLDAHIGLPDATSTLDGPESSLSIVITLEGRIARRTHHTEAVPLCDVVKVRHLHHLLRRHGDDFLTVRDDLPAWQVKKWSVSQGILAIFWLGQVPRRH